MNRGSSSLKSTLYDSGSPEKLILTIAVDQARDSAGHLKIADPSGKSLLNAPVEAACPNSALEMILSWLDEHRFLAGLAAVGQRLVHGGSRYREPQRITPEFLTEIEKLAPLDPDHTPAAIQGIQFIASKLPNIPQVACFDTAFHASLPMVARMYALPRRFYDQGIFRFGFHGLSYEYIMGELRQLEEDLANGRVIVAHLGSGASMAAIKNGKSIDTSMGFTPLEGLVMSTRSGDVDPGMLLYLFGVENIGAKELSNLLNKQSGLLGVSGTSADMKRLLAKSPEDPAAAEAVDLFCYRAKKYIGAYAAALGGLDVLVFAGGIGEHAPIIRKRICEDMDFLGIKLDEARNEGNAALISSATGAVRVRVIKTNEDLMIVRHVLSLIE
jgi:acetate kinase